MLKGLLAVFVSVLAFSVSAGQIEEGIAKRLSPVGSVCVEGSDCAAANGAAAASVSSGPRTGEEVYNGSCTSCHAIGVAGAPKFGDVAAWEPRVSQGMDVVYDHAIAGYNAMPAKGLCMDCSDEEVKLAVDYIVDNSK